MEEESHPVPSSCRSAPPLMRSLQCATPHQAWTQSHLGPTEPLAGISWSVVLLAALGCTKNTMGTPRWPETRSATLLFPYVTPRTGGGAAWTWLCTPGAMEADTPLAAKSQAVSGLSRLCSCVRSNRPEG